MQTLGVLKFFCVSLPLAVFIDVPLALFQHTSVGSWLLRRCRRGGGAPRSIWFDESALHNFAPVYEERTVSGLVVCDDSAMWPCGLRSGFLVRNGPNAALETSPFHLFDGDGMLHCVEFDADTHTATYRNRFVRTTRFLAEQAAQRPLFPRSAEVMSARGFTAYMLRMLCVALICRVVRACGVKLSGAHRGSDGGSNGTANTSVVFHAGRLLALCESDRPYVVSLPSLETLDRADSLGLRPVTAHPKIDPLNGEFVYFSWRADRTPYCTHSVADARGQLIRSVDLPQVQVPVMMHDFAITEHFSVLLNLPYTFQLARVLSNHSPIAFDATAPACFLVLPRHATTATECRVFVAPRTFWSWHVANAWEECDEFSGSPSRIVLATMRQASSKALDSGEPTAESFRTPLPAEALPALAVFELDLRTGTVCERTCCAIAGEFPVINPAFTGRKLRFVFYSTLRERTRIYGGVVKVDLAADEHSPSRAVELRFPPDVSGGEVVFVPRHRTAENTSSAAEDDAFLMVFVFNHTIGQSALHVYDARSMASTPVCVVALPHRVPHGFHGTWVDRSQIR